MNFFEKELRNMFGHTDIIQNPVFAGRCLIGKLGDDIRVKLQFIDPYVRYEYTTIQADIINKSEGLVDRQSFRMLDIIGMRKRESWAHEPYIWENDGTTKWYGEVLPSEKAKIADTILSYVEMYQSPNMSMSGPSM